MAKMLMIGIDWFGPYDISGIIEAKDFFKGGLYLAIGKPAGKGNHIRRPQYIGISTDNVCGRVTNPDSG